MEGILELPVVTKKILDKLYLILKGKRIVLEITIVLGEGTAHKL